MRRVLEVWELVLGHRRVDLFRPRQDATHKIAHLGKAGLPQKLNRLGTAHTRAAMRNNLTAGIEFIDALGKIIQWDQVAIDVTNLIFVRLAYVENKNIVAR